MRAAPSAACLLLTMPADTPCYATRFTAYLSAATFVDATAIDDDTIAVAYTRGATRLPRFAFIARVRC